MVGVAADGEKGARSLNSACSRRNVGIRYCRMKLSGTTAFIAEKSPATVDVSAIEGQPLQVDLRPRMRQKPREILPPRSLMAPSRPGAAAKAPAE